jgi:hypothetical protein
MDREIEIQLQKVLSKVSMAERQRNRSLMRQTMRLVRAMVSLKSRFNNGNERND